MKKFDTTNWYRTNQFEFFKNYEDPFFNITANLEIGKLYDYCKRNELSFFLSYMYVAMKACNDILEFRLRLFNGEVYEFDTVFFGSTILNDDNSFFICYFNNGSSLAEFVRMGRETIDDHKAGQKFETRDSELGVVHCTTIPWLSITGFKHARNGNERQKGIPKLVFGKMFTENGSRKIPLSVEGHHALMDGYHVSILFEKMQTIINELS